MAEKELALDFVDIAMDELDSENKESAEGFVREAVELIEDDNDLGHITEDLEKALEHFENDNFEEAYDATRAGWAKLANI